MFKQKSHRIAFVVSIVIGVFFAVSMAVASGGFSNYALVLLLGYPALTVAYFFFDGKRVDHLMICIIGGPAALLLMNTFGAFDYLMNSGGYAGIVIYRILHPAFFFGPSLVLITKQFVSGGKNNGTGE